MLLDQFKTQTPLKDGKPLKQSSNSITGYLESLQLAYNANGELETSITIKQEGLKLTEVTATYYYDAFGRRIAKQTQTKDKTKFVSKPSTKIIQFPVQQQKTTHKQIHYLWDGNRQAQEYTDTHVFTTIHEQNSFEPVARLVWLKDELLKAANDEIKSAERERWEDEPKLIPNMQVYHYHNDHLGTPNELTNDSGEVVWLADYEAWGNTAKVVCREEKLKQLQVSADELQPIRFQGQSFDTETGLHYNRFRYFDPDLGMFISRDPIGLMGGTNTFAYAPNPTGWIDPLGLANVISNVDPSTINYSQHYIENPKHIDSLTEAMKNGDFDWDKYPLDVQMRDGEMVSGDNRRLYAANQAGCNCSIIMREPTDPLPGGGTYGRNLDKKMNSSPLKSGLPRVNVGPNGTKNTPVIYNKDNRTLNGVPIKK